MTAKVARKVMGEGEKGGECGLVMLEYVPLAAPFVLAAEEEEKEEEEGEEEGEESSTKPTTTTSSSSSSSSENEGCIDIDTDMDKEIDGVLLRVRYTKHKDRQLHKEGGKWKQVGQTTVLELGALSEGGHLAKVTLARSPPHEGEGGGGGEGGKNVQQGQWEVVKVEMEQLPSFRVGLS
jgi:hypothetical protein